MLKLAKTTLLSCALIALTALPAAAQSGRLRESECERNGGHTVNGKCEMPAGAPQAAPPQRGGAQEGNQGGGRGGAPQGAVPPNTAPQEAGRGARGQGVVPQGNVQQGSVQQGNAQRGRGGAQQGGLQEGNPQQGNVQQGRVQQGNDRNNNFGPRDNGQYGNTYGPRDNGRYGNTYGRNFDQNEFNRRYYGRYGYDPDNFQRNRQIYRAQQRWRERYPHDYVYADDSFYRDCRTNNEVGGAVVGAILGGLLGNSLSQGQGGATLAGIILGGAGGAALAGNLDCEDRTYVYPTYYEGFERGRRQASYPWRNERTGHYGTLLVGDYYRDQDNYRCATYTQTIYVRGAPRTARGHACRQDDGTWVLID
jgi:surface antigen